MRKRYWWRALALSAAFAVGGAAAQADEYVPQDYDGESYATAPSPVAVNYSAELQQILARMERQDREIAALRGELAARQTPAIGASLADAPDDPKAADGSPLKKVAILVKPVVTIEGRTYFDHIMFEDDPALVAATGLDRQNETGFNTTRIGAKVKVYENISAVTEVEFEGSETDFKDVFIQAENLPVLGTLRAGHFKEPFSLEELTSSRFITFMGRSTPGGAFTPGRNFGVMAFDDIAENDNWTWFAGAFRHDSPDAPAGRASHINDAGDWCFTGRVAGLLYYDEPSNGRYLVHVGGDYSARTDTSVVSFSSRPELGSQAGYLSSTFTGDRDWDVAAAEAAIVWGPSSVQAEYFVGTPNGGDNSGGYVEATYFVTGENRAYKKESKAFDRVKPIEDFFRVSTAEGVCMGRGAWQLKARYSWLDLNEGLAGNRGYWDNFAAGANWYWNPYTRMMFDYVYEDLSLLTGVQGSNNNFGMRWQIDF